jgi:hypothetical protein
VVVFHGSVSEYAGAGEVALGFRGDVVVAVAGLNVDAEGDTEARSRVGSGRVFFCAREATCSMLISVQMTLQIGALSVGKPKTYLSQIVQERPEPMQRKIRA